jgi:hypothetical protein
MRGVPLCRRRDVLVRFTCSSSQLQNWVGAVNYWVLKLIFEVPAIHLGSVFP